MEILDQLLSFAKPYILTLLTDYPIVATIFMVMGACRVVLKPLMSLLKAVASVTATPKDNALLAKIESSKLYVAFSYLLDWAFSLKLPKKDK